MMQWDIIKRKTMIIKAFESSKKGDAKGMTVRCPNKKMLPSKDEKVQSKRKSMQNMFKHKKDDIEGATLRSEQLR